MRFETFSYQTLLTDSGWTIVDDYGQPYITNDGNSFTFTDHVDAQFAVDTLNSL